MLVDCITRIHVITGWSLPDDKNYIKILLQETAEKLKSDYPDINIKEFLFAFRKYGVSVNDWGKNFNINMVCTVLNNYLSDRRDISLEEERAAMKPEQKIYTDAELDNIQRQDIEDFYQRCRKGIVPTTGIPSYFTPLLIKDGFMAEGSDDPAAFFSDRLNKGVKQLYITAQ